MGVKASYCVVLKSAQAKGCLCSIKCLFKDIRPALTPFFVLTLFLLAVSEISRQMQMFSTNRRDLPHSAPFPFVGGVDR
jgi:hypothetical protein